MSRPQKFTDEAISAALSKSGGDAKKAALLLGCNHATIYNRTRAKKRYGQKDASAPDPLAALDAAQRFHEAEVVRIREAQKAIVAHEEAIERIRVARGILNPAPAKIAEQVAA